MPLPPSLELVRPVRDLRAFRKGDQVFLTWTTPSQTTERQNLRHGGVVDVCRAIDAAITRCGTPLAQIPFQRGPRNVPPNQKTGSYTDPISSEPSATSNFVYALSVLNSFNRSAGLSNQVQVPAAPTLQPPSGFHAQLAADGVRLSWDTGVLVPDIADLRFVYRIYRREQGTNKDSVVGELPVNDPTSTGLLDHSLEWEKTYDYRATIVTLIQANGTERQVEGDDTPSVRVVAHDIFPPATPTGLQAAFSGPGQKPFIDLVWTPNTEADLAGYNIYRHEETGPPVKLNSELIKSPDFRDTAVLPGHQYFYSISAVDVRGNESPHSAEANETVPAP